jgi:hypothetical protein
VRHAPAQHRLDARLELARREGLGHVIVHAALQPLDLVVLAGARREHDDGHFARARLGAQLARERRARAVGQHPVEEDQVGKLIGHRPRGFLRGGAAAHGVAVARERDRDELLDRRLVLDHEDHGRHQLNASRSTSASGVWRTSVPFTM